MAEQPLTGTWLENNTSLAPPPFMVEGDTATPIEVRSLGLVFEIDPSQQSAVGHARLRFMLPHAGRPLLDLVPRASRLSLNGQQLDPARLRLVLPPEESTPLRMVDEHLAPGEHTLEISYTLSDATVQFVDGGARLGLFMTDLDPRGYLERHAPANLEFDQLEISMEVRLSGTNSAHQIFSNGRISPSGNNSWQISFPDYFNCASCYLHLTNREMIVRQASFAGMEREIPITVYSEELDLVSQALATATTVMSENEHTYGPYAHEGLLIYCTPDTSHGMEYAGATMTGLPQLGHEITHSWFARGVMPANSNAGWIDEAIARWRDLGYPQVTKLVVRPPVKLSGFSPYTRQTPHDSYVWGSRLLSELELMFSPGGLRPILARLFRQKQRQLITTPFFQTFLEQATGIPLGPIFDRYVYGKSDGTEHPPDVDESAATHIAVTTEALSLPPPRAFTTAELRTLL